MNISSVERDNGSRKIRLQDAIEDRKRAAAEGGTDLMKDMGWGVSSQIIPGSIDKAAVI